MQDAKRADRGVALFVALAFAASLAVSALLWALSKPIGGYNVGNALFLVPALSVMIAALGVGWRRKVGYILGTFFGFVLLDLLASRTGLFEAAARPDTYLIDAPHTLAALVYQTFVITFSLIALVFFVGRKPAVLWTRKARV